MSGYFEKLKKSRTYGIIKAISTSAVVALFLSFAFFTYDVYKENNQEKRNNEHFEKTVQQLDKIKESLSTRFLGSFPSYLTEINNVFNQLQPQDTVIIFEDVLYYGIKSRPTAFCRFNHLILNHARQGGTVVVAYYDNHPKNVPFWASVFHRMIVDSRIDAAYLSDIPSERKKRFDAHEDKSSRCLGSIDSLITEEYFAKTKKANIEKAKNDLEMYLKPLEQFNNESDVIVYHLCQELDSIKNMHIGKGKTINNVSFADYEKMYSDMTDCIVKRYQDNGIKLIQLNEYLTMSCWLLKPANVNRPTEAILAFPSKYATEEIGFYSQDASFATYISAMLKGVEIK